jgi:hypothetical protein
VLGSYRADLLAAFREDWQEVAKAVKDLPRLPRDIADPLAEAEALLWVATLLDPERPASRLARARAAQLVPDRTFQMLSQETSTRAKALRLSPPSAAQSTTVH